MIWGTWVGSAANIAPAAAPRLVWAGGVLTVLGSREKAAEEAQVCRRWAQSIASSLATRHIGTCVYPQCRAAVAGGVLRNWQEGSETMSRKDTCCKAYKKKGRYCKGCPRKGKRR